MQPAPPVEDNYYGPAGPVGLENTKIIYVCSLITGSNISHLPHELFCNSWSYFIFPGYLGFNREETQEKKS